MSAYLSVALGGALGAMSRFALAEWLTRAESALPWGTLCANALGCFLLGLLIHSEPLTNTQNVKLLVATGFCGGFTTMSAFVFEFHALKGASQTLQATSYLVITLVAAILAFVAGQQLFRLLSR